jgi:hypothetical protein
MDPCKSEDELDALERLTARVHVLEAQLQRHKMQKRKKVVWKISEFPKRGNKSRVGVRNWVNLSALSLKHPETANQLLLGSGTISSKVECELKRKLADMMGPEEGCKKTRVDASPALVEAEVDLPRMIGSVQILKKKPGGSKMPKVSHKRDKLLDEILGTKKMLLSVNLEQEQQLEAPHYGHIEQVLSVNLAFLGEDLRVIISVFMLS